MVIESPISNDALLKLNPVTGKKERVPKLLLQIPVRELHNDLLKPVEEGGLAEARDDDGRALISDTALRSMMPEQLRRATERHKRMCGCETCITVRSLQQTLNAWRKRHINKLKTQLHSILDPQLRLLAIGRLEEYQTHVLRFGNKSWHERPSDAVKEIQCPAIDGLGLPKWKCVLRRCDICPTYDVPLEEKSALDDSPRIVFHSYLNTTKCSKHGELKANVKSCEACEMTSIAETEATLKIDRKGKVRTRKCLTLLEEPIGNFMYKYYLPAIEKYSYHRPHVIILRKKHCGAMKMNAFKNSPGSVKTRRDYAERLSATFDLEIQSEHFGNGRSLSMEGSSVEFHIADLLKEYKAGNLDVEELEQQFEFVSHFSDVSRQDSTTTNAHMDVLIRDLKLKGRL